MLQKMKDGFGYGFGGSLGWELGRWVFTWIKRIVFVLVSYAMIVLSGQQHVAQQHAQHAPVHEHRHAVAKRVQDKINQTNENEAQIK